MSKLLMPASLFLGLFVMLLVAMSPVHGGKLARNLNHQIHFVPAGTSSHDFGYQRGYHDPYFQYSVVPQDIYGHQYSPYYQQPSVPLASQKFIFGGQWASAGALSTTSGQNNPLLSVLSGFQQTNGNPSTPFYQSSINNLVCNSQYAASLPQCKIPRIYGVL